MPNDCDICAEEKAGKITCDNCSFHMCRPCLKRYTLERPDGTPTCPSCAVQWPHEQQVAHLSSSFLKGPLRKRKRDLLLAQEHGRLPSTTPAAQRVYYTRKERETTIQLSRVVVSLQSQPSEELLRMAHALRDQIEQIQSHLRGVGAANRGPVRCAHTNCGHFLDTTSGVCMACERTTCLQCSSPVVDGVPHVCDEATLESIRAVNRECRPCAGCSAMTVRTEGCPVMWCAYCHAFWNWDTGEVLYSRGGARQAPHNPDHRNWLANSGGSRIAPRETGDVPCGGVPSYDLLHSCLTNVLWSNASNELLMVANALLATRSCVENAHVVLRPMFPVTTNREMVCHDLRVSYLLGDVSKTAFETKVESRYKKVDFQTDVGPVAEMFTFAGIDVLLRISHMETPSELVYAYFEMMELRELTNRELERITQTHGRKTPHITETWQWKLPYRARAL